MSGFGGMSKQLLMAEHILYALSLILPLLPLRRDDDLNSFSSSSSTLPAEKDLVSHGSLIKPSESFVPFPTKLDSRLPFSFRFVSLTRSRSLSLFRFLPPFRLSFVPDSDPTLPSLPRQTSKGSTNFCWE